MGVEGSVVDQIDAILRGIVAGTWDKYARKGQFHGQGHMFPDIVVMGSLVETSVREPPGVLAGENYSPPYRAQPVNAVWGNSLRLL
jgi:hypothetical protein